MFEYDYRELLIRYYFNEEETQLLNIPPFDYQNSVKWHYWYNPLNEREQKRMVYASVEKNYDNINPWVYYLLDQNANQFAVYHGIEISDPTYQNTNGQFCTTPMPTPTVFLYPTEYNTYGAGSELQLSYRYSLNDSTWLKHFKIHDHIGNIRSTIKEDGLGGANISGQYDYEPFGALLWSGIDTELSKDKFISKEKDVESSLGDYGVRKYDDYIGRFMQVDPMWEKYYELTPYNYSANNPLILVDKNGMWFTCVHEKMTNQALSYLGCFKPGEIRDIIKGNASVDDSQNQVPELQFQHWMLSRTLAKQYISDGIDIEGGVYNDAIYFIENNLDDYINNGSLESLGAVLHTIQDSYCPGHEGFQEFHFPSDGVFNYLYYGASHLGQDFSPYPMKSTNRNMEKNKKAKAYDAAYNATKEIALKAWRLRQEVLRTKRRMDIRSQFQANGNHQHYEIK
jgi:RHS repeat-associated protein